MILCLLLVGCGCLSVIFCFLLGCSILILVSYIVFVVDQFDVDAGQLYWVSLSLAETLV